MLMGKTIIQTFLLIPLPFVLLYNTTQYNQLTVKQNSTKTTKIYFKMKYGYDTTPLKKGAELTD